MNCLFCTVPARIGSACTPSLRLVVAFALALGLVGIAGVPVASAATITVTTTADELDVDGNCSLREAIRSANLDTAVDACPAGKGADRISLPPGTYIFSLSDPLFISEDAALSGDLDISGELAIVGARAGATIIDASGFTGWNDGIIDVLSGASMQLSAVTLQGSNPGDIFPRGGAIWNSGKLLLADSVVRENRSPSAGGIGNFGSLTVSRSTISDNIGRSGAGAIDNSGTLVMEDSTVSNNLDRDGPGGIYNGGSMTLRRTLITGNTSFFEPGGIVNGGHAGITDVHASMVDSTISGNEGGFALGGTAGGLINVGTLQVLRSTINGNLGGGGGGSGVENRGALEFTNSTASGNAGKGIDNLGTATISSSTVAANAAGIANDGTLTLANTILADNKDAEGFVADCIGAISSLGYNLVEDATGCTLVGTKTGNLIGVDPDLGPLQNNGGPTETQALLPQSAAIDAGSPARGRAPKACPANDQRGVPRPQDGDGHPPARCDIGAYELQPPVT